MKRWFAVTVLMMLFVVAALFLQACEVSTASVVDVRICDDLAGEECEDDMAILSPDTMTIYASGKLKDAPEGTSMTITWRYMGGPEVEEQDIDSVVLTTEDSGSGPFSSSLVKAESGWVNGKYEVVFDLGTDNSEPVHKEFEIK